MAKLGVPRPVTYQTTMQARTSQLWFNFKDPVQGRRTGSQPWVAGKPSDPQPGFAPAVTSFRALAPAAEYKNGFKNPNTFFPAASRRSLISAMKLANVGVDALVQATLCVWFSQ